MSAARVRVTSAAQYFETEALVRGLSVFLLVCAILFIFFAATFPFDFAFTQHPFDQLSQRFDWNPFPYDENYTDRTQNIIFFIPFGFVLAAVVPRRQYRAVIQIALSLVCGFVLTCCIESLQAFVSFRDPSLADVWCNTLGSAIGGAAYAYIGDPCLRFAASILLKLKRFANPITVGAIFAIYAIGQLAAPVVIKQAGDMSSWDNNMPLVVGFATGTDRPWNGTVYQISLADRAADASQVHDLAKGAEPATIFGDALLGDYKLVGQPPYADASGHLAALNWVKDPGDTAAGTPPQLSREHTLATTQPIKLATYRIGQSSEFTLSTLLATDGQDQRGPAVFLAISGPDRPFNVQLGQEFGDLSMRLRTTVRGAPEMYLRGVFDDNKPHHIAITQKAAQTIIYVDGFEHGRVEVTPEAKMIWRLYPRGYFRMWIDRYGYRSYAAIYRILVFIPFAALLAATLFITKLREKQILIIGAGATVAMAVALELILGNLAASGFELKNLLISLLVGAISLGALILAHHRSIVKKQNRFGNI